MWKFIPDTDEKYAANDETGEIKRCANTCSNQQGVFESPEHILKPWIINSGYAVINLCLNNKVQHHTVHRLVAKTFKDNYNPDLDVNHLNGIKTDNRAINLECCTRKENLAHARENGLAQNNFTKPENRLKCAIALCDKLSKPVNQIDITTNEIVNSFYSITDAAKAMQCKPSTISHAAHSVNKTAKGYKWEFAKNYIDECND